MDVDVALAEVPVNVFPLTDATDFKTIEDAVAYNAGGMALRWHFVTTGGSYTVTSVTPTTGGDYDWTDQGDSGIYTIEIPASGGASINNDTEGFGWFTGSATGVLPWRGPVIGFRAAALNNSLIDAGTTGLLAPTTAARTLDVTAGGNAGIDWANVEAPTTTLALTGTTIATTQQVDVNTIKTQTVTCGAGVTVLASVGTAATSTAQTGDSYALANGSTGFVAIDTVVDAIKAKTDSLTFTVANVLDANTLRLGGTVQTARDIGASVLLSSGTGTGQLSFTSGRVKADTVYWNAAAVATPTTAGVPEVDITFFNGVAFATAGLGQMDDHYANLGYITAQLTVAGVGEITTNVSAGVWLNGTRTLTAGTNINGSTFTSIPWNAAWDTEVQSECADALTAYGASTHSAADVWAVATRVLTAGTNIQLPSNGLANVTAWTVDITGNLSGSVGSVTGGINTGAGVITTLDALDTAQDTQHGTTQAATTAIQADLPARITKNTALAAFMFKMVDATDHNTAETSLTVTATRSLDGAAFGACANAASEVSNGWYKIDLAAADLNANVVVLRFTASGADTTEFTIVTQNT